MRRRASFWDHNELGVFFLNQGLHDLAIRELKRAVQDAVLPVAVLHINLGAAYLGKQMYPEAQHCLQQGLALEPGSQRAHWLLAEVLRGRGAITEAVAEYEHACGLDPDSPVGRSAEHEGAQLTASLKGQAHPSLTPRLGERGGETEHGAPVDAGTLTREPSERQSAANR
jgi:tetratricopeptide (TPR) repeat protein